MLQIQHTVMLGPKQILDMKAVGLLTCDPWAGTAV